MKKKLQLGYLRTCIDRRFVAKTRELFEETTGLGPEDYWHQAYAGGAALFASDLEINYAIDHGAVIIGFQAHGDKCGGQPGVLNQEIEKRLDMQISLLKQKFPDKNLKIYRIFATENKIDIKEV